MEVRTRFLLVTNVSWCIAAAALVASCAHMSPVYQNPTSGSVNSIKCRKPDHGANSAARS